MTPNQKHINLSIKASIFDVIPSKHINYRLEHNDDCSICAMHSFLGSMFYQ